jgi:hypothetical protein
MSTTGEGTSAKLGIGVDLGAALDVGLVHDLRDFDFHGSAGVGSYACHGPVPTVCAHVSGSTSRGKLGLIL